MYCYYLLAISGEIDRSCLLYIYMLLSFKVYNTNLAKVNFKEEHTCTRIESQSLEFERKYKRLQKHFVIIKRA
jgi:hypothetical protein